uniref:Integrase catalytic domain-containing protein n=1 Tax=Meloidogyne enterolobii TaxID=390850 RepID=A0A6V7YA72_MELEN|nr:unnamed protein product [Meloidogyne enterolobii]
MRVRELHMKLANLKNCSSLKETKVFAFELERLIRELRAEGENTEGPVVYLALEKKLNKNFLREILNKKSEEGAAWSTTRFREVLHETLQREMSIQEVINEYDHERAPNRNVPRPPPRRSLPTPRNPDYTYLVVQDKNLPKFNQNRAFVPRSPPACVFCNQSHWSDECRVVTDPRSRIKIAEAKGLCTRCLGKNHSPKNCWRPSTCFYCKRAHPGAFCFLKNISNRNSPRQNVEVSRKFFTGGNAQLLRMQPPQRGGNFNNRQTQPPQRGGNFNNRQAQWPQTQTQFRGNNISAVWPNQSQEEASRRMLSIEAPNQRGQVIRTPEIKHAQNGQTNVALEGEGKALLMTVEVMVSNPRKQENKIPALVFLDPGSQRSFVSKRIAEKLELAPMGKEDYYLSSFGSEKPKKYESELVRIDLLGKNEERLSMVLNKMDFIVNPLPCYDLAKMEPQALHDWRLCKADWRPPDVLLGMDIWHELNVQPLEKLPSGFTISTSRIGNILSGAGLQENGSTPKKGVYFANVAQVYTILEEDGEEDFKTDVEHSEQLSHFFGLHGVGLEDVSAPTTDEEVMENFRKNLVFVDGRYQVALPFNKNIQFLPTNYRHAKMRLASTLRKLRKLNLVDEYEKILKEQYDKGMIEKVENPSEADGPVHYLPHRAVVRMDKTFTKVRIVMDASARPPSQPNAPSLNNCLHTGPLLLKQLVGILLRFRFMDRVLLADIEKAFLQLGVRETDRDCTRFLWLEKPKEANLDEIQFTHCIIFRFTRVSFGLTVSPFLLNATLQEHLGLFESPVARSIEENLYVDNIMIEMRKEDRVEEVCREATEILEAAGMSIREFFGVSKEEFGEVPEGKLAPDLEKTKILGLYWYLNKEKLTIPFPKFEGSVTKRQVLSTIAKIYDPLGLISPCLIPAKKVLQKIFEANYKWDVSVSRELVEEWQRVLLTWNNSGTESFEISFPRRIPIGSASERELHCFVDASGQGFGAAVYLRTEVEDGIKTNLIFAKSLIKPLNMSQNEATIPRLELQAIMVGVKSLKFLLEELKLNKEVATIWTDSLCNVERLNNFEKYDRFIANRIVKIRGQFKVAHVISKDNPADLCSRGVAPEVLINNKFWWSGPEWLEEEKSKWPPSQAEYSPEKEEWRKAEEEKMEVILEEVSEEKCIIDATRFSKYQKLLGATVYAFRFLQKILSNFDLKGPKKYFCDLKNFLISKAIPGTVFDKNLPSLKELQSAEWYLLQCAQEEYPPSENVKVDLNLYLAKGLWRCQGRIDESELPEEAIKPIWLPNDAWITRLIVLKYHIERKHCGTQTLLGELRQRFWLTREDVSFVENLKCQPYRANIFDTLPKERVREARPFANSGIDFFGPLSIKEEGKIGKAYGALFTCLVVRAIHLEFVEDLSAVSFLQAYRRFISRRGIPKIILSDNATNFQMGAKIVKKLNDKTWFSQEVQEFTKYQGTLWRFNTPRNPQEGGAWERLIGITKKALKRCVGKSLLNRTELTTLFCELESVVNSRPLTFQSDREPIQSIRPIDFLIPYPQTEVNFPDLEEESDYEEEVAGRTQITQQIRKTNKRLNKFWEVWRNDYLLSLRERTLGGTKVKNRMEPVVGDIVLVEEALPRSLWKLDSSSENEDEIVEGVNVIIEQAEATVESSRPPQPYTRLETRLLALSNLINEAKNARNPGIASPQQQVPKITNPRLPANYRIPKKIPEKPPQKKKIVKRKGKLREHPLQKVIKKTTTIEEKERNIKRFVNLWRIEEEIDQHWSIQAPIAIMDNREVDYGLFSPCIGDMHSECKAPTVFNRNAYRRDPAFRQYVPDILLTLMHCLAADWFSRQRFPRREIKEAVQGQLLREGNTPMITALTLWQYIKEAPLRAFPNETLKEVLRVRQNTCKVFRSLIFRQPFGPLRLQLPPQTPDGEIK